MTTLQVTAVIFDLDDDTIWSDSVSTVTVTDTELARAWRMRSAVQRDRFVRSRIGARRAIAAYLSEPIDHVSIESELCPTCKAAHRQPRAVVRGNPVRGTHLSLTRSGRVGVVAISSERIGVDVESIASAEASSEGIVASLHQEEERGLAHPVDPAGLAQTWCRKEAALKLHGAGLDIDPRGVDTSAVPIRIGAALVWIEDVSFEVAGDPYRGVVAGLRPLSCKVRAEVRDTSPIPSQERLSYSQIGQVPHAGTGLVLNERGRYVDPSRARQP